jgi:hypothetical protein
MIAVLPFQDLSPETEQEYFSDGLTEETISHLGRFNPDALGVIARTSSMAYKRSRKNIGQIGRELGVDLILESSVRREGRHVRISSQLIRVNDQTNLWSATAWLMKTYQERAMIWRRLVRAEDLSPVFRTIGSTRSRRLKRGSPRASP